MSGKTVQNDRVRKCANIEAQLSVVFSALSAFFLVLFSGAAWASDEPHAEGSAGLPQFDATTFPQQIFWLLVAFVFLYGFFSRSTLPTLSRIIENRREHIQSDLDSARRLGEEAAHVQKIYEESLEKARTEASAITAAAIESARHVMEKNLQAFHEKAEHEILSMEKRTENTQRNAVQSLNLLAAEASALAVEKLSGIHGDKDLARSIVEKIQTEARTA